MAKKSGIANEQKWPDWPALVNRWGREQLVKRRQRGEITPEHSTARLLDWMAIVINAAFREYQRREALVQEVQALREQLEIVKDLIQVEFSEDEAQ